MFCQLALLTPPYTSLTYEIPSYFPKELWQVGMRVAVPLGNGACRLGIITKVDVDFDKEEQNFNTRPLLWCMEKYSLFSVEYMDMIRQLALRQLVSEGRILGTIMPASLRTTKNIRIRHFQESTKPKLYKLRELNNLNPEEQAFLAKEFLADRASTLLLAEDAGLSERMVLCVDPPWNIRANAHNQRLVLEYFMNNGSVSRRNLLQDLPQCRSAVDSLLASKMIAIRQFEDEVEEKLTEDFLPPPMPHFKLNSKQEEAYKELAPHLENFHSKDKKAHTALLYGVTGSGKTALYLELAEHCLRQGKSVMLLAPEVAIALKLRQDAMERKLPITLYHGYQNPRIKEKIFRESSQITSPQLIIGTRSALFLPINNLGCIILDEEHDDSFKQNEGLPYHAKEIAWYRIMQSKGLFLMGSATPDIKSFYATEEKLYQRLEMPERIGTASLPTINLVDMSPYKQALAPESILALKDCLSRGEQAIIMLNRRGYSPLMYCLDCKKTVRCPHCDISLAYHKKREVLTCHYCGYSQPFPSPCSSCKGLNFLPIGDGTEKLEESITELIMQDNPYNAKVLRLDKDSTRREGRMEEILNSFAKQEAQVLVGTQMLSKGHHFPNVTLALIADADLGLNFPDYRAAERTFQLIMQAAGRAGRGKKAGTVLIQTKNIEHYCWDYIKNHDYNAFYAHEIALRESMRYPPFTKLALIRASWPKEENQAQSLWQDFVKRIKNQAQGKNMRILGSSPAPLGFLQGRFRMHCLIKGENWNEIRNLFSQALPKESLLKKHDLRIQLDLDPVNML